MSFLLTFLLLLVATYVIIYGGIVGALKLIDARPRVPNVPRRAFPVELIDDGAGRYRICGVERETEKDQQVMIEADSRANALVKAELRGIVVTRIEKLI
jgi:hypothetical protein